MRTKYKGQQLTHNQAVLMQNAMQFQHLANTIVSRAKLGQRLGKSFSGDRELYEVCGYPQNITFKRYLGQYERHDIAKRVVDSYPNATWRGKPNVFEEEDADTETAFEKKWDEIVSNVKIYNYFNRVDKLSRIGRYAVLFLGTNDQQSWDQPLESASELSYLSVYSEDAATINKIVDDKNNERFNMPENYKITISKNEAGNASEEGSVVVHWTRIIHIADGMLSSDVFGTPALECIYNRLQDLEMLMGGSAEMFWRGAFPGLQFDLDKDAKGPTESDMEDEIEEYIHGMSRTLKTQGITTKELRPQVANPKFHVEAELQMISCATGIPVRILTGSERGELASSQDENNWNRRVDERRHDFAEPIVLRPFIDRLIEIGILPEVEYQIEWPDIDALSEQEQVEVAFKKADTLNKYLNAPGADEILPPIYFLTEIMGMQPDKAQAMIDEGMQMIEEAEAEAEEARIQFEKEQEERRKQEEKEKNNEE